MAAYGKASGRLVVIDSHNAGLFPAEGRAQLLQWLADRVTKMAALTIVTNEGLAKVVTQKGGIASILPDPLPEFQQVCSRFPVRGKNNVLFICTWARDEPYVNAIESAELLRDDVCIYVTGKSSGRESEIRNMPDNVILTGFLSEDDFVRLLFSVDVIVDLTTREDCLVCGAYEAVSVGVPMVLSDTSALREYFGPAALYCDNSKEDIAQKISTAIEKNQDMRMAITDVKRSLSSGWSVQFNAAEEVISRLLGFHRRLARNS